ncbi:MAG: hypothetical protein QXL22_02525 [Candidatus Nezhaarchaeales archaeon]
MDVLRIRVPESFLVLRLYLYSFLNIIEASKEERDDYIILRGEDVSGAIIDGLKTVVDILEERRKQLEKLKLDMIPMSGKNDKAIFTKLCSEISCELNSLEIFEAYIDILKRKRLNDFKEGLEKPFSSKGYSLPSIFKLELYGLTRGPLFKDGFSVDLKIRVSLDFFILLLAGYIISRIGRTRIEEGSWASVHVLPLELAWSKSSWQILQNKLVGFWHGIRPADALIIYLIINLWDLLKDEPHNLLILTVSDPVGPKPAAINSSLHAPLRDIYLRSKELLNYLLEEEWSKNALLWLARKALDINFSNKKMAEKFVKLLFLSLQGDIRALEELSLLSSRLEASILMMKQRKDVDQELLSIARDARKISGKILSHIGRLGI